MRSNDREMATALPHIKMKEKDRRRKKMERKEREREKREKREE